ncbi:MAG: ATP-binding protein [Bacillota bacterium]
MQSLQWRLVLIYLLLLLLAVEVTGGYLLQALEHYYLRGFVSAVDAQAQLVASFLERYLVPEPDRDYVQRLVNQFAVQSGNDIAVLGAGGELVAYGSGSAVGGQPHILQAQVARALAGARAEAVRLNPVTEQRQLHLARPIRSGERVLGAVYIASSLESTYRVLGDLRRLLLVGTSLALAVTAGLGYLLSLSITRPIREVTSRAERMAAGDFSQRISVLSHDEIGQLGSMFNYLTSRLDRTLEEIRAEKAKLEAVLTYMAEGLMALDSEGRVVLMNPACARLLGLQEPVVGRSAGELVPGLLEVSPGRAGGASTDAAAESVAAAEVGPRAAGPASPPAPAGSPEGGPAAAGSVGAGIPTARIIRRQGRILHAHFAPLGLEGGERGLLVVLRDVTEETRLQEMRRDFVANVSHELRTPLATVKGYVETLLDGALEDRHVCERFLHTVAGETDRMTRLVQDLLLLSQLEHGQASWHMEPVDMRDPAGQALERLRPAAERKGLRLVLDAPDVLPLVEGDEAMLTQVFSNLLSNAVEFTPSGGSVTVSLRADGERLVSVVEDTGTGIPPEDLPRVFERFYRVDKGRSRELGGTGLGLSIAREIVQAHRGDISITSVPGQGTRVTFWLPRGDDTRAG